MVSRALGSETAKLPFTWSDKPDVPERHAAWAQHPGKLKADGSPVTVFVFNKTKAPARVAFARNALRRARTLRHPDLVKLVEGIETETQIVIATEAVTPLARLDWHQLDPLLKCWGLYKMAHLLNFFHADCRLAHLNFSLETVQVTAAGEWKLTGLDLADAELPNPFSVGMIDGVTEHRYPPEMANANWSAFAAHPLHAVDAWAFGCLVYELYIKQAPLQTRQEVLAATQGTRPASVHVSLYTAFRHLVRPEPKMRGTLDKFLKQTGGPNGFFDNHFVKTSLFLEHITLKSVAEKEAFASQLAEHVNEFPLAFTKYKILPELCQAVEYGGVGARGIPSVLRIGQRLDEDDVQKMLVPLIVRLFASTDRSIRVSLLSQLDEYHRYLDANTISDAIYPSLCTGFSDSNAIVREHTLRSILVIADKLNEKILNNTLLRFLAKLQTDPEPGIRTNTTILLGKLATKLRPQIAQSVLVPAFTRAFKDSFPPARIAGMAAIGVTHELYPLADICNRILPHVMPLLMDPEKPVRQQAFKILDIFV
ncbi:ARM repeat-containing protein, partial [Caulochytrium protostelioides]